MAYPNLFYDNRLADAALAASTTAAGYSAASLVDWRPYTWWKPTALPATLTVDSAAPAAADYALVYGHTLYTAGCTVEVRASTDNFAASDVLVASATPTSDDPFLISFTSVSYRYWRLRITGAATMPALAIAAVGARLTLPTGMEQGFDPIGRRVEGTVNRNEAGHAMGRSVSFELWRQTIKLQRVSWSWLRATWLPAWRAHLRGSPFVIGWDVDAYAADLKLVTAGDSFSTPHYSGSTCDLQLELTGVVT